MSPVETMPALASAILVDPTGETIPTPALKERLAQILMRTADDLREMAAIVAELERRGEDLSGLRLGIVDHLRRIAAGQLLPEIVVRYAGYPALLRIATALPLPDQRRMLDEPTVRLAVWREGRIDFRLVDPLCLTPSQLRQVYSGDRLRNESEQIGYLESRAAPARPHPAKRVGRLTIDRSRGGLVFGKSFFPSAEIVAALALLVDPSYSDLPADSEQYQLPIRLTAEEHRRLKIRAAENNTSGSALLRRAVVAAGLL